MDCCLRLTFRQPVQKPWSDPSDSNHPDDLLQSRYVTPWFKPFSYHETVSSYLPKEPNVLHLSSDKG